MGRPFDHTRLMLILFQVDMNEQRDDLSYLQLATDTARKAGALLKEHLGRVHEVDYKYKNSMVTEADKRSERLIVDTLLAAYPDHSIVAEEGSDVDNSDTHKWIIDPLDGTTNFLHTFPYFCVSIALEIEGTVETGVVYNPMTDELFTAERGKGALLNSAPVRPSRTARLTESLVVTGFSHEYPWYVHHSVDYLEGFIYSAEGIRRFGSAALDLCHVASGRTDGFWELGLHPWDIAAAALILEEAGGRVSNFSGETLDIYGIELLSSNGLIHTQMLEVIESTREQIEAREARA